MASAAGRRPVPRVRPPAEKPTGQPTEPPVGPPPEPPVGPPPEPPVGPPPEPPVDQQVRDLLRQLRAEVKGVLAAVVATSDGLLIAEDAPDLEAPQLAALTSTMTALARHAVEVTRRGELLDAMVRGTQGHLAVFAIGDTAVLALVAHPDVTVAWLHLKTRQFVGRLTALADRFDRFYTG